MRSVAPDTENNRGDAVFRSLLQGEQQQCLDLWLSVWPGETNGAYFRRYFESDVEWLPYYTQVAEVDGEIVSTVQICKRIVECGEFSLTMGGIGNVATLPEHRGKGYNSSCLQRALAVMEADAMDFSLLFTSIHPYYSGFGYAPLDRNITVVKVLSAQSDSGAPFAGLVVRMAKLDDFDRIGEIYDVYNTGRPITVRRSAAYWRDWLRIGTASVLAGFRVACSAAGDVLGYLRVGHFTSAAPYSATDVEARVIELGIEPATTGQEAAVAQALLSAVAHELSAGVTSATGNGNLRIEVPVTGAVQIAIQHLSDDGAITVLHNKSAMVRILHPNNLMKSFSMVWNERWLAAGRPPGTIVFETPYGYTSVNAAGPLLSVETLDTDVATKQISQSDLFGLMFGAVSAAQATDDKSLHALLSALFPAREMIFWGADGF